MRQEKKRQHTLLDWILYLVIGVTILFGVIWNQKFFQPYEVYNNSSKSYQRGTVSEVESESLEKEEISSDRYIGTQTILVEMKEGELEGQQIEFVNYLSATHNIYVSKGTSIIVCVDAPENVEPYYTVYNYDRSKIIYGIVIVFFLLLCIIGRSKGMKSALSLMFAIALIVFYLLPAIYEGFSPVLSSILIAIAITVVTILLLNGTSKKSWVSIAATISGVSLSAIFYCVIGTFLKLNGFLLEEGESLIVVAKSTGLQIESLVFVSVVISSLGAVMDVGISITAALFEIVEANPKTNRKQLFHHGMNIGKDIIGSMCNTLILAYAGGGIATLLVLVSYGTSYHQLISSDYLAVEIAVGLSGSFGMILTIPMAAILSTLLCKSK